MLQEKKFYLTSNGLKKLQREYKALQKIRKLKLSGADFPTLQESEDLNPEYLSLQEDLNLLEARLADLDNILKNIRLIKAPSGTERAFVGLGAKVAVEVDGQKDEFFIVGSLEANPDRGWISNESPVGKALMGHKAGDMVVVHSSIKIPYKILKISY